MTGIVTVQPHHKGFPVSAVGRPVAELAGTPLLTADGANTPALVIDDGRLAANIQALQGFCAAHGVDLAPHVKTSMSPRIIGRQLAAGAWAVTVATTTQLRTLHGLGARRVLLANELVEPAAITWLGERLDDGTDFTAYCYVDSSAGLDLLTRHLAARGQARPLPVLVEVGRPGGRTGVRDHAEALRLAAAVAASPVLRLAGVAAFEGIIDAGLAAVEEFLLAVRAVADDVYAAAGPVEEFVVTAGGSAYLELVPRVFAADWRGARPIRVVMRSGCYVTHDAVGYAALREQMSRHTTEIVRLVPAMTLWSRVLSRPEPGLALLDFGRRDVGTDAGLPVVELLWRGDGDPVAAPAASVVALNDQHAYVRAAAGDFDLRVGDLVGLGISHPCTVFDKWRLIPIVDAGHRLVDVAETLF